MDGQSKIRRSDDVVARDLSPGQGGVLLHLESADYFGVNQVGMVIWDALESGRTVAELVEHVRSRVADPPAHLEADVHAFLESAAGRGVIVVE